MYTYMSIYIYMYIQISVGIQTFKHRFIYRHMIISNFHFPQIQENIAEKFCPNHEEIMMRV